MAPEKEELSDKLFHVVELSNEGIWTLDADGRTNYINLRGAEMLGYRPEELIGHRPSELCFPEWTDPEMMERMQKDHVSMLECRVRRKDGTPVWALGSSRALYDQDGRYQGAMAVFIDVTERRRAEDELRRSEERFRALVTASSDVVYRASGDWSEILEVHGGPPLARAEGDFGNCLVGLAPPEDRPRILAAVEQAVRSKEVFRLEHRVRGADGAERWVLSTAVPMVDPDGSIREWFGTAKDVTKRKLADDALRKSKQRFEVLSETNSILLSSREPENVIQSIAGKVLRHLDCDIFSSYILDELQGRLRLKAYYGVSKLTAAEVEWMDLGTSVSGCVARDGLSIVLEDVQNIESGHAVLLRSLGVKAYACFPIHIGVRVIGTLAFGTRERTRFEADETALMRIVAEQVSVSVKRRRAELAVKEREEHFARAQRIAHMGSFSWDINRDLFYLSEEACRITGLEHGEAIHKQDIMALICPEDAASFQEAARKGLAAGICDFDHRLRRADGEVRYFQGQAIVSYDPQGRPAKMVGTAQDVTERRLMETRLKENEEHLAQAQEIAHLGSWVWDLERDRLQASDEALRILGLRPGEVEISYQMFLSFVHPEDRERVFQNAQTAYHEEAGEIEYRIVRKDGEIRDVHSQGTVARGPDGRPLKVTGIIQDITARKRTENELKMSQQRLQAIIETNLDFIWEMDARGRYTYCSPQMESLWGLRPESMIGKTPFDMMPQVTRDLMLKQFIETASDPRGFRNLRTQTYDGQGNVIQIETSGVPFFDGQGKLLGFRGITRDVSTRKESKGR